MKSKLRLRSVTNLSTKYTPVLRLVARFVASTSAAAVAELVGVESR